MQLCVPLGSFAPVEHQPPSPVLQEHLALMLATHIKATALFAPQDIIAKVGHKWHTATLMHHRKGGHVKDVKAGI